MRLSRALFVKAPFPTRGNRFDTLFVAPEQRKKAWDGQDKDAFFRDKYAHVHAKQLKKRAEEQRLKRERLSKHGESPQRPVNPLPKPDFYQRFNARVAKRPILDFIYGTNAVRAALQTRVATKLYTGHKYLTELDDEIRLLCEERDVPIECGVPAQHLQIMSQQGVHNKVVLETEKRQLERVSTVEYDPARRILLANDVAIKVKDENRQPLGLFIDQVTDTHNMGALLRSALWFGVDFVAFSSRNSAPFSPAVVRASSGAAEFVPLWEVEKPLKFFESLHDWAIVATAPNPEILETHELDLKDVPPYELSELDKPTLLVVGSEGDGIRTSLLQRSTHSTSIPSAQTMIDSLNVSVATAVLLSHMKAN